MRILFTGGGSGGHIFPIIAVKQTFEQGYDFYYLGPNGFAKRELISQGIKTRFILAGKFRRYFSLNTIIDLIKIPVGIVQSFWYLFIWVPDVIFSKGGYGSFPVVLVAWIYKIPIILHESDSAPGLANQILAKFAKKIILSFSSSEKYFSKHQKKLVLIGNPIRREITQGNEIQGRAIFKIGSDKPVVLIIGGSQGAKKINEIILNTLPRLLEIAEIIHVTGELDFKRVEKETTRLLASDTNRADYHLYSFLNIEQIKHGYAIADLIVNRAGAGSIFEISALGKPSILIPLPDAAQDHQKKNAYEFTKNGRAIVLEQPNLTPNMFLDTISDLLKSPSKLGQMSTKARTFYNPQTPELIKREILKFVPSP